MALYGKMPSVTYQDYPEASLIILWGVNPSASGIHLIPYVREAQKRGASLVVVDPRTTALARSADVHLAVKPGTDVAVALAIHRHLFANGYADEAFLGRHARGADRLRERAECWTIERASEAAGVQAASLARVAQLYAESSLRSYAADGASNATATAETRRWPCWRCLRLAASSAFVAAGTR